MKKTVRNILYNIKIVINLVNYINLLIYISYWSKEKNRFYKEGRKLRIHWNSNSVFCHSGYGTQSNLIVYALLKAGFPIAHTAFYGLEGYPIVLDGLKIFPKIGDMWGADAMIFHSNEFKADVNCKNDKQQTALDCAVQYGNDKIIKYLERYIKLKELNVWFGIRNFVYVVVVIILKV